MKIIDRIAIIVHGGAWAIPNKLLDASTNGVEIAAKIGWDILKGGGTALDAVEKAVNSLEENPVFDAGIGASLNEKGEIELDAIIVDGKTLDFGAVAGVKNIIHTVSLARKVMEKTDHVFLIGEGANIFASEINFESVPQEKLITKIAQEEWNEYKKFKGAVNNLYNCDTVGAVAIDAEGDIAAATSTGGITGKRIGRVGDSPIIGSGAFADNSIGGISTTGHGESILKIMLAKKISQYLENGQSPNNAVIRALDDMKKKVQGNGGAIIIDKNSEIGFYFTSKRMAWAYVKNDVLKSGI
ncbi:MAG: isoaspartyl peptidase/L-asparaginase [Candidatus Thorarchaeota archaeon]